MGGWKRTVAFRTGYDRQSNLRPFFTKSPFTSYKTLFQRQVESQRSAQAKARGRIVTDSWLRMVGWADAKDGSSGVFSIGDCAMIEDRSLPATAQVASQQGAYLGRMFSKGFNMKAPFPSPPARRLLYSDNDHDPSQEIRYFSDRFKLGQLGATVFISYPAEL